MVITRVIRFGGDYLSIIGACDCRAGQQWDDRQLECQQVQMGREMDIEYRIRLGLGVLEDSLPEGLAYW